MIRPLITAAALALALGLYFAGYLSPGALAAALTFAGLPGADALVRALRPAGATAVDIEAAIESTWWRYDRERKQSGDERYTWKKYIRAAFDGQIGVAPTPPARSTPPSLPPAALLLLLPFLLLAPSCAGWPAWRSALAACGVQVAPAGVQSGVALALHKGEGWAEALGELVSIYGGCLVKAQVQAHAEGAGSDPPRAQAEAAPLASLIGGELAAAPSAVTKELAQQRAQAWLKGHR